MNKQNTLPPDKSRAELLRNEEPSVTGEHIQMLPLNIFFPFANHPYQIRDDPEMQKHYRVFLKEVSSSRS